MEMDFIREWLLEETQGKPRFRTAFLSTVVFFLLGNGYAYVNAYPIHDGIIYAVPETTLWQLVLGRFLIPVYYRIRGGVPTPIPILLLCLLYLGVSHHLICLMLDLRKRLEIMVVCAFLSINMFAFEISAVHQYFADVFLLSLLFSCLGVYMLHDGISVRKMALSVALFFVSFGLYPAFLTFAVCMFMLLTLKNMYEGKAEGLVRKGAAWIFSVTTAGLLYLVGSRIALLVTKMEPSKSNQSIFSLGDFPISRIGLSVIRNCVFFVRRVFFSTASCGISGVIATVLLALTALVLLFRCRPFADRVMTVIFFLAFPVVSRAVNIVTRNISSHRTVYAQYLFLPALIWMFFVGVRGMKEEHTRKLMMPIILLSAVILWNNLQFSNYGFLYQRVLYDRTVYHVGQVLEDYADLEAQDREKPVVIIGQFQLDQEEAYVKYRSVEGFTSSTGINYEKAFVAFAARMGYQLNCHQEYAERIKQTDEVKEMPIYPENGYIAEVDGCLVIKLEN